MTQKSVTAVVCLVRIAYSQGTFFTDSESQAGVIYFDLCASSSECRVREIHNKIIKEAQRCLVEFSFSCAFYGWTHIAHKTCLYNLSERMRVWDLLLLGMVACTSAAASRGLMQEDHLSLGIQGSLDKAV